MNILNLKTSLAALLLTATITAQDLKIEDIPKNLSDEFKKAYPTASDVEWEMEGNQYQVEFEIDRRDHEIWYDADAKVVKSEQEISKDDLPEQIKSTLSSTYGAYKIEDIETTEENNTVTYVIDLEKGWNDEKTVVLDKNGTVTSEYND